MHQVSHSLLVAVSYSVLLSGMLHLPQPVAKELVREDSILLFEENWEREKKLHTRYCSSSASFRRFLSIRSWAERSSYTKKPNSE